MSTNSETPPFDQPVRSNTIRRMLPFASGGEILLCLLVRKIIRTGRLDVQMPSGREHVFGEGPPLIALRIATIATVWRLLRNPELALGEAFMDGTLTVERGSIYDLLELVMANLKMSSGPGPIRLQAQFRKLLRRIVQHNPVVRSQTNVAHHYDLSDKLYDLFLDAGRQYSCAYYTAPTDTLEQAQAHKLRHIAAKLLLQPGQKVLDIGSGWGGLGRAGASSGADSRGRRHRADPVQRTAWLCSESCGKCGTARPRRLSFARLSPRDRSL